MYVRCSRAGFTLIELMISVAIVGLLSATAIPSYLRYTMQAKQVEAHTMLDVARAAEMSHLASADCFFAASLNPHSTTPPALGGQRRQWSATPSPPPVALCPSGKMQFEDVGVRPYAALVYFEYSCERQPATPTTPEDYACCARGDLDEDSDYFVLFAGTDYDGDGQTIDACEGDLHQSSFPDVMLRISPAIY